MAKNLVIVESPAKARTVGRYLGDDYNVVASLGHVRDLPQRELGVDVDDGFAPSYEVMEDKKKLVREIRRDSKDAPNIYLATDPDREGEAIAWHLVHSAGLEKRPLKRVVFHEITEEALKEAFQQPRDIDLNLVNAQQTRRILDRLVGYKLSPVLWQKVVHHYARRRALSAGRVQSVALRLIVDREREIQAFVPKEYWTIDANLETTSANAGRGFKAGLHSLRGQRGRLEIPTEADATELVADLEGAAYKIAKVRTRQIRQRPAAPFTTSSLQQEAWRKLRFSTRRTMALAQQLYEGLPIGNEGDVGLITYMRTDSTNLSSQALREAQEYIRKQYGADYAPKSPRTYTTKTKSAQEAHEAIRPTSIPRDPDSIAGHLSRDQRRLYELIWKRTLASQMTDALLDSTSVEIDAATTSGHTYMFRASGSVLKFPGFRRLYLEDVDDSSDDGDQALLPEMKEEDVLKRLGLDPRQHFTQPPPKFTEASIVKTLEEQGIGRPSTYAPTISTIQDRHYVTKTEGRFKPTSLGMTVCDLLNQNFPDIMNAGFTAQMEEDLDEIAQGSREWVPVLGDFYEGFSKSVADAMDAPRMKVEDELTDQVCEECERPMGIKMGRFGPFLSCTGFPECRNSKPYRIPTGANCPRCSGDLVQRRGGKKGTTFYGCSNYPNCDFSVRQRPIPAPCPECGELLVASGRNRARCTACDYKGDIPEPEEQEQDRDRVEVAV